MDIIFLTNSISPHQVPLCAAMARRLRDGSVMYIYTEPITEDRQKLGWSGVSAEKALKISQFTKGCESRVVENCQVLLADIRDVRLFERRAEKGLITLYISERWFKPPIGILRMLHPKYFVMAWKFVKLLRCSDKLVYLSQGIHASRDMARLCGLFVGDLRCLFRAPKLDFEHKPGGRIYLASSSLQLPTTTTTKYCLDKMRMWGYYVEPSKFDALPVQEASDVVRVLWVGRLLNLKRVDTIVRAVGEHANLKRVDNSLPKITLDIYGSGPEEKRLKKMAAKYGDCIKFYPPVPIAKVRKLMREHNVYVLSSNAYEGWGAVVSEAIEEGMKVVGTYEAGSSATILPKECLFHAGDYAALIKLLQKSNMLPSVGNETWAAENAADALIHMIGGKL